MENTKNLFQRLAEVRKECNFIKKENVGSNLKYKAVSSDMVLSAINNSINTNGLFLMTEIVKETLSKEVKKNDFNKEVTHCTSELEIKYTWVNIDKPEDQVSIKWSCSAVNTDPAKANGAALTYSEKYFILKFFNMVSSENEKLDPDCQAVPEEKPSKPVNKTIESPKKEASKVTNIDRQFDMEKCNDKLLTFKYIDQVRLLKQEVKKYYGEKVFNNSEVQAMFRTYESLPEAPVDEVVGG